MLPLQFVKYQGTGNDFIIIDNRRAHTFKDFSPSFVQRMCDRRFGVGADGLMLLNYKSGYDFEMQYFNADGRESTLCGNGGRCIVAFAKALGIIKSKARFIAIDGEHIATINDQNWVELKMQDVPVISKGTNNYIIDTGSPHYVTFVKNVAAMNIKVEGRIVRNSAAFKAKGINVNFVEILPNHTLKVHTYERGVEDETLSCGTGVTAAAIAYCYDTQATATKIHTQTKGGNLEIKLLQKNEGFVDIWLCGATSFVFDGNYTGVA